MIMEVPRDRLPTKEVKVGDQFRTSNHPTPLKVTKVTASHVTLDANHPLAGMDLTFDVEVTGMREATEEELASAHQCCGNHSHGCCGDKEESHGHDHDHGHGHSHKHSGGCCH
jgi:FKBP-type peptidyl-prolyl cis-trans isomerase SlyD